jgi:hypothetical protein
MSLRNILGCPLVQAALCCTPAFAQVVNLVDGPVNVVRYIPKENQPCGTSG